MRASAGVLDGHVVLVIGERPARSLSAKTMLAISSNVGSLSDASSAGAADDDGDADADADAVLADDDVTGKGGACFAATDDDALAEPDAAVGVGAVPSGR